MRPETVSLLCTPGIHEPLRLASTPGSDGAMQHMLVGVDSGTEFPLRNGIPLLVDAESISGLNLRYQRFYNRIAWLYDGGIKVFASLAGKGEERFRQEYLQELALQPGDCMLEVSIGTGANLRYLPTTATYIGLDLSWAMLARCQRNLRRWQRDADLILGNAEALPLRDATFDKVLHVGGINAFNDRAGAIREMVRVARSGSRIVIVDETAKLMHAMDWMPTVKWWLREHGDRLGAPVDLVPAGMHDVEVKDIARGNMYCLTFTKP